MHTIRAFSMVLCFWGPRLTDKGTAFRYSSHSRLTLVLKSMDTIDDCLSFWEATKFSRWQRRHNTVTTKARAKDARKAFRALSKKAQKDSMLNMGRPKFYRPIPLLQGEREKRLFAAHQSRKEAGWIRG